jgi:hypothetical protein
MAYRHGNAYNQFAGRHTIQNNLVKMNTRSAFMKKKTLFLLTICAAGLIVACVIDWDNLQNKDDTVSTGGLPIIYEIEYTITVVNNTNTTVQLYKPGGFFKYLANDKAETGETSESRTVICTVSNKGRQTGAFLWNTYISGFYAGSCYPGVETYEPPIEDIKAGFKPYITSFYLKLAIDSEVHYLAGWPDVYNANLVDYQGKPFSFPANKIKANGIGYCENTEIRINNAGYAYPPFIVHYDGKSSDFDTADSLAATATLTVNSPDDIRFETTSIVSANLPY